MSSHVAATGKPCGATVLAALAAGSFGSGNTVGANSLSLAGSIAQNNAHVNAANVGSININGVAIGGAAAAMPYKKAASAAATHTRTPRAAAATGATGRGKR